MRKRDWIIKNQKGLSAVVTTLIVILLVLVAVGIVWVVVKNLIGEGAEEIELGKSTLDLEIKAAQIGDSDVTVVVVRRNPGKGNFIGMNFIFSNGTNSEIIRNDTILEELEEKRFTFILTEINTENLETISVAPIFELSSGEESEGNVVDSFEVTEEMKAGITGGAVSNGGVISNFEMLGYTGAGKVEYGPYTSDIPKLPEFRKAIVDPLDVLPGDSQTFTVHVYSPNSIVSVTTTTELDNSTSNLNLEKIGTDPENPSIEIWSVNWTVDDVHTTTYRTNITAIDSEGNQNYITLTWTDSCMSQLTHGANDALTVSCSTGVDNYVGLDVGDLTVNNGVTLTLDTGGHLIFNPGQSIMVNGQICVHDCGGSIDKGYLFYADADGDYYGTGDWTDLFFNANPSSAGHIRASSGSLLGLGDCDDGNTDVNLGQTSYFATDRGDGSFDYNCDFIETQRWTDYNGGCATCWDEWEPGFCVEDDPGAEGWGYYGALACGEQEYYVTRVGECRGDCEEAPNCNEILRTQECR